MSKKASLLLGIVCLIIYSPIGLASELNYKSDELIVRFAPKPDGTQLILAEKNDLLAAIQAGTVTHSYRLVPGLTLVKLPVNLSVEDALTRFKNSNEILYAELNYVCKIESTEPNDPYYESGDLWGLKKIDANDAWDIHTGSSNIIVAVIDTGVNYTHPDLASNMWKNQAELNGTSGVDDDNNGYIDDIYGYDFCTYGGKQRDSDPMDDQGHGTSCAGIIGAVGNNNKGVTGVCWNVRIMALKWMDSAGYGNTSDAIECIDYAVEMGANILNNSWKIDSYHQGLRDEIKAADANGVLFVASAGNTNMDNDAYGHYPSSYDLDNIIAVMATNQSDSRWFHDSQTGSNYGATSVDLAAPGSNIYSCNLGGGYISQNGTSMAAPYVAGACALLWSVNPWLSHWDVKRIILDTTDKKTWLENDPTLGRLCVTGGRLNVYNAVIEAGQLALTKIDDVNYGDLVLPDDYLTYTISYGNPVTAKSNPIYIGTVNDVNIIDYLPDEIDFISASGPNMVYDSNSRAVTWQIGTLTPGKTNSVTLTVNINELAEPLGSITNVCVIDGTGIRPTTATEITDVNCWSADVIYVDVNATGSETGMSWGDAYTNLQKALERASECYIPEIWVAAGTYKPTTNPADHDANFALIDGVAIYGGFSGNGTETSSSQRNWHTNETILTGDVDNNGSKDMDIVVTADNVGETTCIDGFTITKAQDNGGIWCSNASPIIRNNKMKDNTEEGIRCESGSSPDIINCEISNNSRYGIYCSYSSPFIANNIIKDQYYTGGGPGYGIFISFYAPVIKNNWIYNNSGSGGGYGIYLNRPASGAIIRNNTIANNKTYGINRYLGTTPNITNCILWDNGIGSFYGTGYTVTYSCIQGGYSGQTNIDDDPRFVAPDVNNYHLDPNVPSPCIDKGDPNFIPEPNETDIDGEPRIFDGNYDGNDRVDMGADEFYWSPADFDGDEIVDSFDYAELAAVWLTTFGEPDYNDLIDLQDNSSIDFKDHAVFAGDWLWQAAWTQAEPLQFMNDGMGQGMIQSLDITEGLEAAAPAEQQAEQAVAEAPVAEAPVAEAPVAEAPVVEAPVAEAPVTEAPVVEAPVAEAPVAEPVDIEVLIQWLDEILADEQIQEQINEEDLQKLIDSLKEQI